MKSYNVERFLSYTRRDRESGCLIWEGVVWKRYGMYSQTTAHRVAHMIWNGPIPKGWEVDHICGNPLCVEPFHLEAVSPAENRRRRLEAATQCRHGHPYSPENTYVYTRKTWTVRVCRACQRATVARYKARKAAAR